MDTLSKQEIGELFIVGFQGREVPDKNSFDELIGSVFPGGVILFDRCISDSSRPGNIASAAQLRTLVNNLQEFSPHPLFVCIDQEGGLVRRLKEKHGFKHTASAAELGRLDSADYTRSQADLTAEQCRSCGINVNFAPVVDLNSNPENPIIGKVQRAFSASMDTVVKHAEIWIQSHHRKGVLTCLKHFPGHGSSASDSHLGFVDISKTWQEKELSPFSELLARERCDMVMIGHIYHEVLDHEFPATLSEKIISGILRDCMGYDGLVVTDDLQMRAITDHYGFEESICLALKAGVDMIVLGNNLDYRPRIMNDCIKAVTGGLQNGMLSEDRLAGALFRIRKTKQMLRNAIDAATTKNP